MIDCPNGDVRDLLPDLLHDRLPPAHGEIVRAHVDTCALCRDELALLQSLRASMRRAPLINVEPIVAALPVPGAARAPRWFGAVAWRAAAAALVVSVGATTLAVVQRQSDVAPVSMASRPVLTGGARVPSTAPPVTNPALTAPRELAVASSSVSDLTDGELATLLGEIETLDVIPSVEVESVPSDDAPVRQSGGE